MYRILAFVLGLALLAGCSSVSDEARKAEAKPINCDTAKEDVATLEGERASVGDRVAAGARTFIPPAAVVDIFAGYYQDDESAEQYFDGRNEVTSGEYNEKIDAKIAEIKKVCNIS